MVNKNIPLTCFFFYLIDLKDDYIINTYQSIYVYLKLPHIFKLFHSFPPYVGVC